jgi:hypothetical protein
MYIVVPLVNREVSRCTPTAFFDFIVVSPAVGLLFLLGRWSELDKFVCRLVHLVC